MRESHDGSLLHRKTKFFRDKGNVRPPSEPTPAGLQSTGDDQSNTMLPNARLYSAGCAIRYSTLLQLRAQELQQDLGLRSCLRRTPSGSSWNDGALRCP